MIRLPISLMCAGLALQLVAQPGAVESIPADHPEPITIRILNGKNGLPLPHLHLAVIAGYDERDIRHHLWGEEVSTDCSGEARLPQGLVDFGFLQVSLRKAKACQKNSEGARYNLATIRRDGLSPPNDCGILRVLDRPGVLTIFARSGGDWYWGASASGAEYASRFVVERTLPDSVLPSTPVQSPVPANRENELESLIGHSPAGASDPAAVGTDALPDSYEEMCQPER
jgi:hypothetical protein